jgi:oxalate decarboxylase
MNPPYGPTPPLLAGADLPSFHYPLGEKPEHTFQGGWAKQATAVDFPVSEALAGVYMFLSAGTLRELHWHANAAEWGYVISGHCRTTVIDPDDRSETADFGPGDVWYFPRGYGHSIQGLDDCLFLLVFDNGYFSEFGTFSISDWIGHTPADVLAKNFGVPAATFARFPKGEVYMAEAPAPGALPLYLPAGSESPSTLTHRYHLLAQRPDTYNGGTMRLVSEREFPISKTMTGAVLTIKPGGLRELHWHPNAAEWQFYLSGTGRMTVFGSGGRARTDAFGPRDVGYVPPGFGHYIENTGADNLEVLVVFNSGVYESISITAWMASNPPELLATNFGIPVATFAGFPKGDVFMPD